MEQSMSTYSSKKRAATSPHHEKDHHDDDDGDSKISKSNTETPHHAATPNTNKRPRHANIKKSRPSLSARDLLQVPSSLIFRLVPHSPLLGRAEAHCFLHIRQLAHQLDCIVSHITTSCTTAPATWIHHSYLRAAAATTLPPTVVVQSCIQQLQHEQQTLQSLGEQNWTLAQTLRDFAPELAQEKLILSDIQDEVCRRMEQLLVGGGETSCVRMVDYCQRLFQQKGIELMTEQELGDFTEDSIFNREEEQKVPDVDLLKNTSNPEDTGEDPQDKDKNDDSDLSKKTHDDEDASEDPQDKNGDSEAAMLLADLCRPTPFSAEKENDEPSQTSKDEDPAFRSQSAAEVLSGLAAGGNP